MYICLLVLVTGEGLVLSGNDAGAFKEMESLVDLVEKDRCGDLALMIPAVAVYGSACAGGINCRLVVK